MDRRELLREISKRWEQSDVPKAPLVEYIATELDVIDRIRGELGKEREVLAKAESEYFALRASIRENIKNIVAKCPHTLTEYHPDASGNNDSHHECCICGAIKTKRGGWAVG